jgi:hypothetical protein
MGKSEDAIKVNDSGISGKGVLKMQPNRVRNFVAGMSAVLLSTAVAMSAQAFTLAGTPPNSTVGITAADIGSAFAVDWTLDVNGAPASADLTATSTWTVVSFTSTTLTLQIDIDNTTVLGGLNGVTQASITTFGFGTAPNTTGSFVTAGAVFDLIGPGQGAPQNFPGGFSGIDICVFADGCAGGNVNNGLQAGTGDLITIALAGSFGTTPAATLQFFPIKFQTNLGSFEGGGTTRIPPPNVPPIPLPAAFPLLAAGLVALGAFARRRKQQAT